MFPSDVLNTLANRMQKKIPFKSVMKTGLDVSLLSLLKTCTVYTKWSSLRIGLSTDIFEKEREGKVGKVSAQEVKDWKCV